MIPSIIATGLIVGLILATPDSTTTTSALTIEIGSGIEIEINTSIFLGGSTEMSLVIKMLDTCRATDIARKTDPSLNIIKIPIIIQTKVIQTTSATGRSHLLPTAASDLSLTTISITAAIVTEDNLNRLFGQDLKLVVSLRIKMTNFPNRKSKVAIPIS